MAGLITEKTFDQIEGTLYMICILVSIPGML